MGVPCAKSTVAACPASAMTVIGPGLSPARAATTRLPSAHTETGSPAPPDTVGPPPPSRETVKAAAWLSWVLAVSPSLIRGPLGELWASMVPW